MSAPDFDLYPDEQRKIQLALAKLGQFEFTQGTQTDRKIFEMAAHNEFGEIGFTINITWQEVYHQAQIEGALPQPTGVWLPNVEIEGRTRKEDEHDHDRHKWGVVKGLADGQPGYVRADGSKHEDPIKKIIT